MQHPECKGQGVRLVTRQGGILFWCLNWLKLKKLDEIRHFPLWRLKTKEQQRGTNQRTLKDDDLL